MKKIFYLICLLFLTSCSYISAPTNYYVMNGAELNDDNLEKKVKQGRGPVFAILPISIPSYLNRPQIVLRESGAKITIVEHQRWAEGLDKAVSRVLATALTEKLSSINGVAVPLRLGLNSDYSIQLEISRYEGNLNENLYMDAFWTIQQQGTKVLQGSFSHKIPAGRNFSGLVEAYGNMLVILADEIAQAIQSSSLNKKMS